MGSMTCPRCGGVLRERSTEGLNARLCSDCWGVWVGVLGDRLDPATVGGALKRLAEELSRHPSAGAHLGNAAIPCPTCSRLMQRRQHQATKIFLDVCEAHGTWFDRGELQRVVGLQQRAAPAAVAATQLPRVPRGRALLDDDSPGRTAATVGVFGLLWDALDLFTD